MIMNKNELMANGFVGKSYKMGSNPLLNGNIPTKICVDELYKKLPLVIQVMYTETSPHTFKHSK